MPVSGGGGSGTGEQGPQGEPGIQGPKGDKGDQGDPGATGASTWGSVTGTLSNQTDLQTALNGKSSTSHNHDAAYEAKNTNIQTHISSTSNPHSVTKSQVGLANVDNTTDAGKPVSTAQQTAITAINNNALYRTILEASGSHIAARVAGTYGFGHGDPLAISATGTLYPLQIIRIDSADFPSVNSLAAKFRIKVTLMVNDVAPTGNFTFGLHPVTRPATSGGVGLVIYTIGAAVSGSTVAINTPAADSMNQGASVDFALPADGYYVLGVVTNATVAASSHLHLTAKLQLRNS